ncbi:MAG: Ankyrin-2 [Piccolia ochrophora]|nr:MAG: Ankyrin-2 [Piccolia ochrophora]
MISSIRDAVHWHLRACLYYLERLEELCSETPPYKLPRISGDNPTQGHRSFESHDPRATVPRPVGRLRTWANVVGLGGDEVLDGSLAPWPAGWYEASLQVLSKIERAVAIIVYDPALVNRSTASDIVAEGIGRFSVQSTTSQDFAASSEAKAVADLLSQMLELLTWLEELSHALRLDPLRFDVDVTATARKSVVGNGKQRNLESFIAQAREAFPLETEIVLRRLGQACWDRASAHVLQDIGPYVCIFPTCEKGNERFTSFCEWGKHTVRQHYTKTVYRRGDNTCFVEFDSKLEYEQHLDVHPGSRHSKAFMLKYAKEDMPLCHKDCLFKESPSWESGGSDETESHRHTALSMECLALNALPGCDLGQQWLENYQRKEKSDAWMDSGGSNSIEHSDDPCSSIRWAERAEELRLSEKSLEHERMVTINQRWPTRFALLCEKGDIYQASIEFKQRPESLHMADDEGNTLLHTASKKGYRHVIDFLVQQGIRPGLRNVSGNTEIECAAIGGHGAVVELLLHCGPLADIDQIGTVFRLVAFNGCVSTVNLLLNELTLLVSDSDNECQTALHMAALGGHFQVVTSLLENGADADARDKEGNAALHLAAEGGHAATTRLLLQKHSYVDMLNQEGENALHKAAKNGHDSIALMLLQAGIPVNAQTEEGSTALHLAAEQASVATMSVLLDYGANIESRDIACQTPLLAVTSSGPVAASRFLLENGADRNVWTDEEHSALHLALFEGKYVRNIHRQKARRTGIEKLRLLLDHGADVDVAGPSQYTPLMMAAQGDDVDYAKVLLEYGANMYARDSTGRTVLFEAINFGSNAVVRLLLDHHTGRCSQAREWILALHEAVRCGNEKCVSILLDRGFDIEQFEGWDGSALRAAVVSGHAAIARLLLARGASIDPLHTGARTPLMDAAEMDFGDMIDILLRHNADADAVDSDGTCPIHGAARLGSVAAINKLLDHGVDIESRASNHHISVMTGVTGGHGWTALHYAAYYDRPHAVRVLLDRGADLEARTDNGSTPLHLAASLRRSHSVPVLLARGADVNARNDRGQTALHLAAESASVQIVMSLLRHGADVEAVASESSRRPLHVVAVGDRVRILQLLLDAGADAHAEDSNGDTPLMIALARPHSRCSPILRGVMECSGWVQVREPRVEEVLVESLDFSDG